MDFGNELSKGGVSKLGELGVEFVIKQFKYLIQHKNIISNLKEELDKLKALKESLQEWEDAENIKGNKTSSNMSKWLSNVIKIEDELHNFCENKFNKKPKCFGGQCPNLMLNYSLGKKASEKSEAITRLKEEGTKLPRISNPKALPSLSLSFTEGIKSLESRNKMIMSIIDKLKDDQLKRISICGMGGVGKTTLVNELIKIVENNLFDKVVMVVVSQNPDYDKIQKEIADCLELDFKRQSVPGRGREILQRVMELDEKKSKVLIVLDDVWKELNFEWIGLSSQDQQNSIKILFTSRNEIVCKNMRSQYNLPISVLLEEEAWSLFQEMAGDVVYKGDINPIAREVARECGGLPLAIVTMGKALCNAEKNAWEVALQQIRNSQLSSFSNMEEYVHSRIELSFYFLGRVDHKYLLFLCGLFPEDFDIPVESLLRHAVGLGVIEATGAFLKVRKLVHEMVIDLKKCFLLLDSEKPGCVKMHDVVRDVVLKISSRDEHGILVPSTAKLNKVKQRVKWLRMSLILDKAIQLENNLECQTLELLQVQSQSEEKDMISWPENFIHGLSKLKVLYFQKLYIPRISSHFHTSVNLHTLQLEGCDVGDISIIGREVKKLEILSFANSNIEELPFEIGNLGLLKLLDLTGCDCLNFISANVLARLSRLEEFYFRIKNFPWLLNKEVIKELMNLFSRLKVLEIKWKVNISSHDLIFKNLEIFWVYVVPYTSHKVRRGYLESNILHLKALDYNSIKNSMVTMQLVKKCEILILEKVKDLKSVIVELDEIGLHCIKDLRVDSCPIIECVIDCNPPRRVLPLIKSLSVKNLFELKEIIRAPVHSETNKSMIKFSYLEILELKFLKNLIGFSNNIYLNHSVQIHHGLSFTTKLTDPTNIEDGSSISAKLFSSNWMKQFPKLETMLLQDCISIKIVFDLEGHLDFSGDEQDFLFPRLQKLEILHLNNLLYVWDNVSCCVQGFQNLRFLIISGCGSLKHVLTSNIVRAIINLEELKISHCRKIENIVILNRDALEDDNKGHVTTIGFNKLCYLSLTNLPNFVSICSDSLDLEYPSLREFEIYNSPLLEISLLPNDIHANQVNDLNNVTSSTITKDDKSNSCICPPTRCMSFLPKYIRERTTNKRINKDHIPSIFEKKTKKGKSHMPILEELSIVKCDLLDVVFYFEVPSHMKTIKIENCYKLKIIVARREERKDTINSFTQLKSLVFKHLLNLVKFRSSETYEFWNKQQDMGEREGDHRRIICHPFIDESLFPNLTYLRLEACDKINILFSHLSLSSLEHLEKLEIYDCKNMQEIISHQEEIEESSSNKIILPWLKNLLLDMLPQLKAFCLGSYKFYFPSLTKVTIRYCPNIEIFSRGISNTPELKTVAMKIESLERDYIIHTSNINAAIQQFKEFVASQVASQGSKMLKWSMNHNEGYLIQNSKVDIKKFHKLLFLVPFNELQMLQHVTELSVRKCDSLVEVFESGGECIREMNDITRYQLRNMTLDNLPVLRHIWKDNIIEVVSFQNLTNIYVSLCHNLKSLFSHSISISLVQLQKLEVVDCVMMEEIVTKENKNTKGGNIVKTSFPKLEELTLNNLPNLECVCSGVYDYDIPLYTIEEEKDMNYNNDNKIQVSFVELKVLHLKDVPKLKCFCSGVYDYDIMMSSIEECPIIKTFSQRNVIVKTPNLHTLRWGWRLTWARRLTWAQRSPHVTTHGDLNLTIHYLHNLEKYKVELQKLEKFKDINEELVGYIKRVTTLEIENCHKLLNCIPSNMMHLFSHLEFLHVRKCEYLEEIFGSNDSMLHYQLEDIRLFLLPKLKHIWKNHDHILGFQDLTSIYIENCDDLRCVFPDVSMATSLPNLKFLSVWECEKMEEIIRNNNNNCNPITKKIIFPSLKNIELEKLPRLKCFGGSSFPSYVELPKVRHITIDDCPEMKIFWYHGILYTPDLVYFCVDSTKFDEDEDWNEMIQGSSKMQ